MSTSLSDRVALRRIGQIAITVEDIERAVQFYRDTLRLRLLFRAPPALAFFECGGIRLMLSRPEGPAEPRATAPLYYAVDDIKTAHGELSNRGVKFVGDPHVVARLPDHVLWMAFFHDSEGNLLALMSEERH
jgi:methylmalonyl-CoA/ethylmalonyl-CoA epimerase